MTDEVILENPGSFGGAANSVCTMDTAASEKYLANAATNPGNFGGAANSVCMMDTAAIGKYLTNPAINYNNKIAFLVALDQAHANQRNNLNQLDQQLSILDAKVQALTNRLNNMHPE